MILQSFQNPNWTVTEAGAVYVVIGACFIYLVWNLFGSMLEVFNDIKKALKK